MARAAECLARTRQCAKHFTLATLTVSLCSFTNEEMESLKGNLLKVCILASEFKPGMSPPEFVLTLNVQYYPCSYLPNSFESYLKGRNTIIQLFC